MYFFFGNRTLILSIVVNSIVPNLARKILVSAHHDNPYSLASDFSGALNIAEPRELSQGIVGKVFFV